MKKVALIASLSAVCFAGSASAEELIAAWDFKYANSFGGLDVDGNFSTTETSAAATYGDTSATFSWTGMGTGGGLSNSADLDANQSLTIGSLSDGFGWMVDANSSASASLSLSLNLAESSLPELSFAAGSQNGDVTLVVTVNGETTNLPLTAGAYDIQTVDLSSLAGNGQAVVGLSFSDFTGAENVAIDNIQVTESSTGGSLFILDNPASVGTGDDWYYTPMGFINTRFSPWLFSQEYGFTYSLPTNTSEAAYVFIIDEPFNCWVFVDQASANEDGFFGYAFNAANDALSGWFYFDQVGSTANADSFFVNDRETGDWLTFEDQ